MKVNYNFFVTWGSISANDSAWIIESNSIDIGESCSKPKFEETYLLQKYTDMLDTRNLLLSMQRP